METKKCNIYLISLCLNLAPIFIGFTTTYVISDFNHLRCEFIYRSGEVYSIQHYVIKFVSDLRKVGGLLWVLLFPPPIKLTATI